MMPIPFLSTAPAAAGASGVSATNAAAGVDFDALLPGGVAPVMPRQGDAEAGKILPANDRDELAVGEVSALWMTPPLWPAVSVPVDAAKGKVGSASSVSKMLPGEGRGPVTVPSVADTPIAPLVQPVRGDAAAGEGAPVVQDVAAMVRAPLAPLVQPARDGEVSLDTVTMPLLDPGLRRGGGGGVKAPVGALAQGSGVAVAQASAPSLFPGEGGGPVAVGSVVQTPVAPVVQPVREGDVPVAAVAQLDPGLHRVGAEAGVVAAPAAAVVAGGEKAVAEKRVTEPAVQAKVAAPIARTAELQPLAPARIAPASQMFAAAIQRAVRDERRPVASDTIALLTGTTAAAHSATIDTPATPLDMARETWPTKMIERIEALRDLADANDTSICLVPDKLGAIDVSLKQDGDTVQVQLNAHQPETRQLLAEAQPKLTEMAEAKGLRLSTQTGDGSANGQQPQQQRAAITTTNHRRTAAEPSLATADDERIA